jgi:uncharacterized cupredoxin-like copper-binding protein
MTKVHNNPGLQFIAAVCVVIILVAGGYLIVRRSGSVVEKGVDSQDAGAQETMQTNGIQEITLDASEFSFSQTTLSVTKGQPVRLVLKNTGKMPHDWVVDELNAKTKIIKSGETDTIEFTPSESGTFSFYCSVGQHRAQGMEGKITVQ